MSVPQTSAAPRLNTINPDIEVHQQAAAQPTVISGPEKRPLLYTQSQQSPLVTGTTRLSPPLGQFFINLLVQVAGFAAAIAFGVYAVKSVQVGGQANVAAQAANDIASEANGIALDANRIAIIDLCLSIDNQVM